MVPTYPKHPNASVKYLKQVFFMHHQKLGIPPYYMF